MAEERMFKFQSHRLVMEDRNRIIMTGVEEVLRFDEGEASFRTPFGDLTLRGAGFHILQTDAETGDLSMEGEVGELFYTAPQRAKDPNSLWRLFRL